MQVLYILTFAQSHLSAGLVRTILSQKNVGETQVSVISDSSQRYRLVTRFTPSILIQRTSSNAKESRLLVLLLSARLSKIFGSDIGMHRHKVS